MICVHIIILSFFLALPTFFVPFRKRTSDGKYKCLQQATSVDTPERHISICQVNLSAAKHTVATRYQHIKQTSLSLSHAKQMLLKRSIFPSQYPLCERVELEWFRLVHQIDMQRGTGRIAELWCTLTDKKSCYPGKCLTSIGV